VSVHDVRCSSFTFSVSVLVSVCTFWLTCFSESNLSSLVSLAPLRFFGQIYLGIVDPAPRHVGTREGRPSLGLQSYDRFISNQDTLPKGGFGNLIGLPLQKHAWDRGNTLFLTRASPGFLLSGRFCLQ